MAGGRNRSTTLGINIVAENKDATSAFAVTQNQLHAMGADAELVAVKMASMWAAYKGIGKLHDAAVAASELEEMGNAVEQVFGDAGDAVYEFAAASASAYGQSEKDALQYMNVFGGILNNMQLTREESAKWATELSARGSDLAALWDTDVKTALEALQSGLSGQTMPLRQFGIDLTQRTLELDAMELGLGSNIQALSRHERAQVTLASIMRQSADASGQFEREIDGLNQQQQIAAAEAENARAAFGEGLVPVFTKLAEVQATIARGFNALPAPLQKGVAWISAFTVGIGGAVIAVGLLGKHLKAGAGSIRMLGHRAYQAAADVIVSDRAMRGFGQTADVASGKARGLGASMDDAGKRALTMQTAVSAATVGIGLMSTAWVLWQRHTAEAKRRAEDFTGSVKELRTEVEATGETLEEVFSRGPLLEWVTENRENLDRLGVSVGQLEDALKGTDAEWDAFIESTMRAQNAFKVGDEWQSTEKWVNNTVRAMQKQRDLYVAAEKDIADYTASKDDLALSEEEAAEAIESTTKAMKDQETAVQRLNKVLQDRLDGARELWSLQDAAADATLATAEARDELAEATKAAAGAGREYADAEEAILDAQRGVADAHRGLAQAQRGATEAQAVLNEERRLAVTRLMDLHQAAIEASTAEVGAQLALERARKEAQRSRASGDDDLTRREAAHKVREAQDALRGATLDATKAAEEHGRAQAAGVEGDERVIDARGRLRDANERVVESEERVGEANRRVGEAQRRRAEVVESAKNREKEAAKRLERAIMDEARAAGDLKTKTDGVTAGIEEQLRVLKDYADDVGPGSSIYERIAAFMELIAGDVISQGGRVAAGEMSLAAAEHSMAGRGPGGPVTVQIYGSDVETMRRARSMLDSHADSAWRGGG